jgi:hypothetical protein
VLSGNAGQLPFSVMRGLELRWRNVADGGVQPLGVPPVDPGQGGQLDVFDASHGPCMVMSSLLYNPKTLSA